MLSRWSTNGQLACPVCMTRQKALRLQNGGKFLCFDCHWCFLSRNHAFRRNRTLFRKGTTITGVPPRRICGEHLYAEIEHNPMLMRDDDFQMPGFKENEHNWMKKNIFWEFPYWQH